MLNEKTLRNLTYGVYLITAVDEDGRKVGCIANSAIQVTSSPSQLLVALNHDNYTNQVIKRTNRFSLQILSESVDMNIIREFGYKSSKDYDKFSSFEYETIDSLPILKGIQSYFTLTVSKTFETETHTLLVGIINDGDILNQEKEMTYRYFHEVKKASAPKNAPTYQEVKEEKKNNKHHFRCLVCGYIEETDLEELPDGYTCPVCGATKDQFVKID